MLESKVIQKYRAHAIDKIDLPTLGSKRQGKVRDFYQLPGARLLITTDRQSAFDRILGLIPFKGQVLNQLSQFWFEQTQDIVPNHVLSVPDPNVMLGREAQMFPVEVIVRGYLTGVTDTSLWGMYEQGQRHMYGLDFPDGLHKNEPLPEPIITPTTHAELGGHDRPLSKADILNEQMVAPELYAQVEQAALAVFKRGQAICQQAGLILVDTKYEFGLIDGKVALTDEVHTPDSSRFWIASTYAERFAHGQEPDNFDKEFLRLWLKSQGYSGEGEPPALDEDIVIQLSQRYIAVYERITGQKFQIDLETAPQQRIENNLKKAGIL
jgi:phosphoribosylaminoimidazole-succinocarboxamide synthase